MARRMMRTGDLNPPDWDYPSVQVYSLVAIFSYRQMLSPVFPFLSAPWLDYLLGRLLNVSYAMATIYLLYRTGRQHFGEVVGLLAAAFLGFSSLHSYNSHFLMTDVPATFFVVATLALALKLARCPTLAGYAAAGALSGLAASTKYPVATVLLVLPVAHLLGQRSHALRRAGLLIVAAITAIVVFVVTSPYVLIDSQHFWHSFTTNDVQWAATGHEGAEGNVAAMYLQWLFLSNDAPVAWLALAGAALALIERRWRVLLIAVFPLVYALTLIPWEVRFSRYLLPLMPSLSLLGGWAAAEGARRLVSRQAWAAWVWRAIIVGALMFQLGKSADLSAAFAEEDVRTTALHWIDANLPPGSRIVREDYTPFISEDRFRVTALPRAIDRDPRWYHDEGVEYLVLSSLRSGRYFLDPARYHTQVAMYQKLLASAHVIREFHGADIGVRGNVVIIYRYTP